MRKTSLLTLAVVAAALTFGVSAAFAGAHFFSASGSIASPSGALQLSWDEAGLGNANVNYTLGTTANPVQASATYACINGGGNHPKAANKQSVNGPLAVVGASFQPQNGRVTVTNGLTAGPLASTLTCPGGQTFVLACVAYSNITLVDTTNNVIANIPNQAQTFVNIGPPC